MSILIGIKKEHAQRLDTIRRRVRRVSVSTPTVWSSYDKTKNLDLVEYVNRMRSGENEARKKLYKLEESLETTQLTEEEYKKMYDRYENRLYLTRFSTLMILEGDII